jgi:3-methylfumaryl-CoA hydratase
MTEFPAWIGRREERCDRLDASRSAVLLAAIGHPDMLRNGDPLPPLHHWLHFWEARTPEQTGEDGHPRRGVFLPPIPLPRRMWAGGRLIFRRPLLLGAEIRRVSTIGSITEKHGRSGKLVFVTVQHEIFGNGELAIEEEQDLVYREAAAASPAPAAPAEPRNGGDDPEDCDVAGLDADPVLLFRYSALTMNSHRIHYDRRYAIEEEGYRDIVVQGPLQATLLADLAVRRLDRPLTAFRFRGVAPALARRRLMLHVEGGEDGQVQLWTSQRGVRTMTATAECR